MQGVRDLYGDAEVAVRALAGRRRPAAHDARRWTRRMARCWAPCAAAGSARQTSTPRCGGSWSLKFGRGLVASPYADPAAVSSVVGTPEHLAAADAVTDRTTTLVKNDGGTLPLAASRQEGPGDRLRGRATTATLADALAAKGATIHRAPDGHLADRRPDRRCGRRAATGKRRRGGHDDEGVGHQRHRPARRPAEARQGPARDRQAGRRRGRPRPLRHRLLHAGADLPGDVLLQPGRDRGRGPCDHR